MGKIWYIRNKYKRYSLYDEINRAIEYIYQSRGNGVNVFGFSSFLLDVDMFNPKSYDVNSVILACKLLENDKSFKDFVSKYNNLAADTMKGLLPMFSDFDREEYFRAAESEFANQLNTTEDANERERIQAELNAIRQARNSNQAGPVQPGDGGNDNAGGKSADNASQVKTGEDEEGTVERGADKEEERLPRTLSDIPAEWNDSSIQSHNAEIVTSLDEVTDDDFTKYRRSVIVPSLKM